MTEDDVRSAIGSAEDEYPGFWYYFDSCLQLNFDSGRVTFIELYWCDAQFEAKYDGISVFRTPAAELVRIISGESLAPEADTFTHFGLDLALWRPVLPSMYPPNAPLDEYRNGRYWQTIGLGHGSFYRDLIERRERELD